MRPARVSHTLHHSLVADQRSLRFLLEIELAKAAAEELDDPLEKERALAMALVSE